MAGKHVKVKSSAGGGEFDCYMAAPSGSGKVPGVVLASAVHGVTADIRDIAEEFAAQGYLAAAPDLFWRTVPGPLLRNDPRFNGRAAAMGFCYGGPYAILGPKRLGYAAGISCHGTQLLDYIKELDGMKQPVCIIWGDRDHQAPPPVLEAYRAVPARMKNVEVHVFPGVEHGYMMKDNPKAYSAKTYEFSMGRALAILDGLRSKEAAQA